MFTLNLIMSFTTRFWNNDLDLKMIKNFFLSLCSFSMIAAFYSCNDSNMLGTSIQPDKDKISVAYDTVHVKTKTVFMDSVLLRNSVFALGSFKDHTYGTTKSDFMAQLYCAREFSIPNDVKQIDSAYIYLYYKTWFGDSTALNTISVYELNNPLDVNQNYYANTDVSKYCDKTKLIANGSFIAGDVYSTDSVRALSTYSPCIKLPVSMTLAERFLKDSRTNPEKFNTPEAFQKYFNGIYVTTETGDGSIVYLTNVELELCYDTWLKNKTDGLRDSLVIGASYFPITKEVKQINLADHPDSSFFVKPSPTDSINYIYAPAGMFTEVSIPDSLFAKGSGKLSGKTINGLRMTVLATQLEDDWDYAMAPPSALLLLNKSDATNFFKNYELNDGVYSFLASYNSSSENYVFDLTAYANKMVHKMDGTGSVADFKPFTDMILIPVTVIQNSDKTNVRIDHMITPAAVKVRSGNHATQPMSLEVLYSK